MHAPQITMVAIYAMSLGMTMIQHGKPKTGNHSFSASAIGAGVGIGVLWWGGFWG